MKIGVVGINHKLANLKLRERLAATCQRHFSARQWTHESFVAVLLSTCNRTEVYFQSEDLASAHTQILERLHCEDCTKCNKCDMLNQRLYSFFGHDCLTHLARVTSGLDSAIMGETEIQGQVKLAYEMAAEAGQLPPDLHFLFQKSLKIGKQLRNTFQLERGVPDVAQTLWQMGSQIFENPQNTRVLFIGASSINRQICHTFRIKGVQEIVLCNRSEPAARQFAMEHQLNIIPWSELATWPHYDWVIAGTKCPHHLLEPHHVPLRAKGPKLLLDLSVPRNIDPALENDPRMTLWNIDEIHRNVRDKNSRAPHQGLAAEMLIVAQARKQVQLFNEKERRRALYCG